MYQAHFQLDQEPFSIAPDPSFLYLSTAHREALAHLMYGFSHGGFVLITGEVGTGKTTLLRNLLKQTPPSLDVAFVLNPRLTVRELLETLCQELGVHYNAQATQTVKHYIDALNRHLLRTHQSGRSTVVIIDEAQNLSPAVLEQVRLLTNLETDDKKLLRIILVGQPELAELLDRRELRQLAQRITARYHLGSLGREDSYAYVAHRLSKAGGHPDIFSAGALRALYQRSGGTPRVINVIADRAMLGAYAEDLRRVSARHVHRAAREVLGASTRTRWWLPAGLVTVALGAMAWALLPEPAPPRYQAPALNQPQALDQPQVLKQPQALPEPTLDREPARAASVPAASASAARQPAPALAEPIAEATSASMKLNGQAPAAEQRDASSLAKPSIAGTPEPVAELPTLVAPGPEADSARQPTSAIPSGFIARPAGSVSLAQRQAYAAVFDRWGADYDVDSGLIPCDFAPLAGLQCLSLYGSWSDIERANLPVVLELWDSASAPYHAGLTRLRGGELLVNLGGDELRVAKRDLRDSWYGAYVVLWQTPPGYRGSIRQGDEHETVGWLRQQLAAVTAQPLGSSQPNLFDAPLHDAVQTFQRSEGLIIDGVVGPATWIRLASRLKLPAPELDS